jgi:hypothetical protein
VVGRRNFPWIGLPAPDHVHAHADSEIGSRGHLWKSSAGRGTADYNAFDGGSCGSFAAGTRRGESDDWRDYSRADNDNDSTRNQAVAES